MQAKYRKLREDAYAQGLAEFEELVVKPTFRDFVVPTSPRATSATATASHCDGVRHPSSRRLQAWIDRLRGDWPVDSRLDHGA
jgi:hypothetical protein